MNPSKQIKTTKKSALSFVDYMSVVGYTPKYNTDRDCTDIHFVKDGEVSADYAVTIVKGHGSYIMVRV